MKQQNIVKARNLRKNHTDAEQFLWSYLRNRQLENVKFRRQQIIEKYIVDFVSFEKNLVIELDGSQHLEPSRKTKDQVRSFYLRSLGYKVLRFWNNEIFTNTEGVIEMIKSNLKTNPSS